MLRPVTILLLLTTLACNKKEEAPPLIDQPVPVHTLILTKTEGYRHESIGAGVTMFNNKASEWNLSIRVTESTEAFQSDSLMSYQLVVLLNTTGDLFNTVQKIGLRSYVEAGGSVLAIHAAADAEYGWEWYGRMLGGWFESHPDIQQAEILRQDTTHPACSALPDRWAHIDEWYNFRYLMPDNIVLLTLDESTYEGGKHGSNHPISWCRTAEGGRVFYTGLGHTSLTYSDPLFLEHIKGAIIWLTAK